MRIEELITIEADESLDQQPERRVGMRCDPATGTAEILRKLVRA
jgi:hypothetical protein